MATRQRVPVGGAPEPLTGTFVGTCLAAERATSKAGNKMVVWHFRLDSGIDLRRWTLLKSTDLHETVTALGLDPAATRLSEAVGRKCRLVVGHDGAFQTIESARPL
jgi:hypothetical protein